MSDTAPIISARDVVVRFEGTAALDGFSIDVPPGSLVALVGPSGCGKTTALRAIAGFQGIDEGAITLRDDVVSTPASVVPPERRRVGMVFQEFALFPHISVAENIGYGVRGADRVDRVASTLRLVGLEDLGDRFPHELSGGEQQRVALARALAPEPEVILLDEPFSNLDAPQRERMRRELRRIIHGAGLTALFVTHDQGEALAIADIVAVMRDGRIVQVGPPEEVYANPVSPWAAGFLGDAVLLEGVAREHEIATVLGPIATTLPDGTRAVVMVRPEWVRPTPSDAGEGRIVDREFHGHDQRVDIRLRTGQHVEAIVPGRFPVHLGATVTLTIDDAVVYPAPSAADAGTSAIR